MSPKFQTVYSDGIHHGLPTFPDHDGKKYTAIVTGANGISGSEIVSALIAAPERWETIYAMSRRPPPAQDQRVKPIAADFKDNTPEQLADLFKKEGVTADYVFFTSYVQPPTKEGEGLWGNYDELEKVNVALLSNFVEALSISNIIPKRFLLQTGGKHYAIHLGPTINPMTEDTPEQRISHPNFYFPQEDLLSAWCEKHSTEWTVTRPAFIIGANPTAAINVFYGLAIYASIQKELGKNLEFPADVGAWDINKDLSAASLIGYFSEWAVLTKGGRNQAFNIVDDSPFSYGKFWPSLADWYGIAYDLPEQDESKFSVVKLERNPPPRGFGKPGEVKVKFSFQEWAARDDVKSAWVKIQDREGLGKNFDPWSDKDTLFNLFATLDAAMLGSWSSTQTMDKAKKLGWHGHVQTDEGIKTTIEKMAEMKMVPPFSHF